MAVAGTALDSETRTSDPETGDPGSTASDESSSCANSATESTRDSDHAGAAVTAQIEPFRAAVSDEPLRLRTRDRYQTLGEHGRGGLGRVLRAQDRDLGRTVAIKELLRRGHAAEARFVREA